VIVVGAEVRAVTGKLAVEWRDAHRRLIERRSLIVRLGDETGATAEGEAAPLPGFSSDSLDECAAALRAVAGSLPLRLAGPGDLPAILAAVPAPAARFALETALLGLLGARRDAPPHVLLGGARDARDPERSAVVRDAVAARAAVARGRRTLKVKLDGRAGATALAPLVEVRRAVGDAVALRADANGTIPLSDLPDRMAALADLGVELVEDPIADPHELPASPPIRVALDEPLARLSGDAVAALAAAGRIHALILKPTALGGALACLALARRHPGLDLVVTHLLEGPVGLAAATALARALPRAPLACGLEPTWMEAS
jgi:o-succinylbenzoate synthase